VSTLARQLDASPDPSPVWRLAWLTPWRCRVMLAVLLTAGFVAHVRYLHQAPINLSGDEAHYWDWSRQLDWSYYSKGPLVALIIRASCSVFGNTMPAVRYPALVLSVMTAVVGYLLTLKLFKSDRLALGVTVLNALVPMFVAGSLLMTIDPPFFFCWATATYAFTFTGVFSCKQNERTAGGHFVRGSILAWIVAGLFVGVGALAKLAALAWLPAMLLFLALDRASRPLLKTAGPWLAVAIALACTTPIVAWNAKHDWVTFHHVGRQTGVAGVDDDRSTLPTRVGEFVGGQIGVLGPGVVLFMIGGVVLAFGRRGGADPNRRALQMLAVFGVGFLAGVGLLMMRSKVQANWPAPAYFTLMILAGYFLATRLQNLQTWKPWRWWLWGTVAFGLIMQPIVHDFSLTYPLLQRVMGDRFEPSRIDPTARLRGWEEIGRHVSAELSTMRSGTFILCDDYQQTALLAFYVDSQPITYCAGSYYTRPKRYTQYDLWPDRRLDAPELLGRDAIVIGKGGGIHPDIKVAFERIEPMPPIDIMARGVKVRSVTPYRCFGFRGMQRPAGKGVY
jgi:4-amino-4-deoxy-L-arabinose transferase-like glycosyltransferase